MVIAAFIRNNARCTHHSFDRGAKRVNVSMASLSIQLVLYSAAWLCLALGFRVKRAAATLWAAGWFFAAMCTGLVYSDGLWGLVQGPMVQNLCIMLAFILLQRGVDKFTDHKSMVWDVFSLIGAVITMEWLGANQPATYLWRVLIFTLAITWPLALMAWRILAWLRGKVLISRAVAWVVVSPILLTLATFWLRAGLVVLGAAEGAVDFANGSGFDLAATLVFLVVLGAFNFSLASLVLGSLIERLRELSATDALTDLPNRRLMMNRLAQEHARFMRSGHAYTLVMMDLDFFKKVNDTYGHTVGDQMLMGVARALRSNLRSSDTLARVGGEEFMLLMPLTDADGALTQAVRIRDKIAQTEIHTDAGGLRATMSLGVAEVLPDDKNVAAVISRADAALYRAKAAGRNGVEVAQRQMLPHDKAAHTADR